MVIHLGNSSDLNTKEHSKNETRSAAHTALPVPVKHVRPLNFDMVFKETLKLLANAQGLQFIESAFVNCMLNTENHNSVRHK